MPQMVTGSSHNSLFSRQECSLRKEDVHEISQLHFIVPIRNSVTNCDFRGFVRKQLDHRNFLADFCTIRRKEKGNRKERYFTMQTKVLSTNTKKKKTGLNFGFQLYNKKSFLILMEPKREQFNNAG